MADDTANKSDQPPVSDPQASGTTGQQPQQPPYQILIQYVKDLSFENPGAPSVFQTPGEPKVKLSIDVQSNPVGGRDVEVLVMVEAKAEKEGQTAYLLELTYGCVVRVGNLPKEALNALLLVEVPRMLFPFVREIVCTMTRSGGFSMLLMAPFDFVGLYRQRMAAQADMPADALEGVSPDQPA